MRFTRLAIISAALTVFAGTAQAQTTCSEATNAAMSCATTSSVAITVPHLASAQAGTISDLTITVADLNTGYKLFNGASVTVKANYPYTVTATAAAGAGAKATSNLLIKTGGEGAGGAGYEAMSSGVNIGGGNATASTTINTFHRLNVGWTTDAPGSQSYNLTYTVTMP